MSYFKYFAWQERGYWRGQKLVPISSIPAMRQAVGQSPTFASLQTYNEAGDVMFCPVYADLDGKDPGRALEDARYIVHLIGEMTNLIPDIYYSGNKGYHIIIPYRIDHPQCHLVAKHFFEYLAKGLTTIDKSVYRSQALLRLPGSPASRPGYFKTQISRAELANLSHGDIADLARVPRIGVIDECDMAQINDEFLAVIAEGIRRIPVWNGQSVSGYLSSLGEEMTPCLVTMLETNPQPGLRNKTVYLLGRVFKKCGFTEQATQELLLTKPHFADFENTERGVSSALRSLFRSSKPVVIGCKNGSDAELMRSFCDDLCHWNDTPFSLVV